MFFQDLPDQDSADIVEINMYAVSSFPSPRMTAADLLNFQQCNFESDQARPPRYDRTKEGSRPHRRLFRRTGPVAALGSLLGEQGLCLDLVASVGK